VPAHLPSIQRLIDEFEQMPGIGRKAAERLAYHVLSLPRAKAQELAEAIRSLRASVRVCRVCFSLAEDEMCPVCGDPGRDGTVLCVVERARDVIQIEKTGAFRGLYHVLQGRLAPLDGVGPEQLRIKELAARLDASGSVREVILALNPTTEGEATSNYLEQALAGRAVKVTRPARGLPLGAEIEFTDASILGEAIRHRGAKG
jgi:recombination protein RecR